MILIQVSQDIGIEFSSKIGAYFAVFLLKNLSFSVIAALSSHLHLQLDSNLYYMLTTVAAPNRFIVMHSAIISSNN